MILSVGILLLFSKLSRTAVVMESALSCVTSTNLKKRDLTFNSITLEVDNNRKLLFASYISAFINSQLERGVPSSSSQTSL